MGLNETYSAIRSQILLMKPLPTVNQAYSMIVQEESQRIQLSGGLVHEASVMFSNSSKSSDRKGFSVICDYCKLKGHRRDSCYRLIGFPPDYKFNKKRSSRIAMAVDSESVSPTSSSNGSSSQVAMV
ncbi:hypothetical protein V6N11_077107 [Hibiscus sabdariffa]|uniref:Uncharacterized protein n=1 Tax=Hibiscus sabdariffa TaxID=183260 RepID=A0ABR2TC32_9ROSI